jgi:hypothetical protein
VEIGIGIAILAVVGLLVVLFLKSDLYREGRKMDEVHGYRDHSFDRPRDE